jgi:hypothetical protein
LGATLRAAPLLAPRDALFVDLDAPFEAPLEAAPLDADLDVAFLGAVFLETAFLAAVFLGAAFLAAPFLGAALEEDLPPELFEAPFLAAAFFVAFAMLMGFV